MAATIWAVDVTSLTHVKKYARMTRRTCITIASDRLVINHDGFFWLQDSPSAEKTNQL